MTSCSPRLTVTWRGKPLARSSATRSQKAAIRASASGAEAHVGVDEDQQRAAGRLRTAASRRAACRSSRAAAARPRPAGRADRRRRAPRRAWRSRRSSRRRAPPASRSTPSLASSDVEQRADVRGLVAGGDEDGDAGQRRRPDGAGAARGRRRGSPAFTRGVEQPARARAERRERRRSVIDRSGMWSGA